MVGSALALALATVAVAAGCSLNVTGTGVYPSPDDGGASGISDATADGRGDGAARDASAAEDASGFDAAAAADSAPPCDIDRDGHEALSCGGDDCCDHDARVHPGATDWQSGLNACASFDYDCNGKEDKQLGVKNCQVTIGCQGSGFDQDTACGAQAAHTWCYGLVTCNELHDQQTQLCR